MICCTKQWKFIFLWWFPLIFQCFIFHASAKNVIMEGQSIKDGDDEPLISENGNFSFGFFSPGDNFQDFRYAGIWYTGKPLPSSVVWVANREKAITSRNGVITIRNGGNLEVLDGNGVIVWSTNLENSSNMNSSAELTDSGNLRVMSTRNGRPDWESFSHPTDTFLPGMKVYVDVNVDEERLFSSWKSSNDPSVGNYSMGIDSHSSPQVVIWEGDRRVWRSGYWTGLVFTGIPSMRADYFYGFKLNNDDERRYFSYTTMSSSDEMKFRVSWDGHGEQQRFNKSLVQWEVMQQQPANDCFIHNRCGAFGRCDQSNKPICSCLDRFEPRDADAWSRGEWSGGCRRRAQLQCETNISNNEEIFQEHGGEPDGFRKIDGVTLPDYLEYVGAENPEGCENKCLENCSCLAYAHVSGINCMIWTSELVDLQHFAEGGYSLYVRVSHSELASNNKKSELIIVVAVVVGIAILIIGLLTWLISRKKTKSQAAETQSEVPIHNGFPKYDPNSSGGFSTECSVTDDLSMEGQPGTGPDLPLYQFNVIVAATSNFSEYYKLGHGGFGHVYKGVLPGNQTIAVKRLSRKSTQGLEEFKNEITLLAKLQHRNLVRLLGCCIHGEEKMLTYEYMPNKSLDAFLFDPAKKTQLDWPTRFNIIEGIARGLLYLHRDSRLRIIHRDLKPSNILLDEEMNPKISDFGMARIFGGNQNEAENTNRVVGTYGYMAPEYAMEGLFSVKSDVYSFGILLLEVISGHRSTSYMSLEHSNLKALAWDLWDKGRAMELIDPSIMSSFDKDEVHRCIHVGMLCVQDSATHRPNMPTVVLMLERENAAALPLPRQPTITSMRRSVEEEDMWHVSREIVSSNNVTVTAIIGR